MDNSTYLILLIGYLPLLGVAYKAKVNRLVDPLLIIPLSFAAATLCAYLGYGVWHTVQLGGFTVLLILLGVYAFCVGMYINKKVMSDGESRDTVAPAHSVSHHALSGRYVRLLQWSLPALLLLICLLSVVFKYMDINRLVEEAGYSFNTLMEKFIWVRNAYSGPWNSSSSYFGPGLHPLNRLLEKLVNAVGYASVFVLMFRSALLKGSSRVIKCIWAGCLVMSSIYSVMSGARYNLICYLFSAGFLVLSRFTFRKLRAMTKSRLVVLVGAVISLGVAALLILYFGAKMRGSTGFIGLDYLTSYLGAGIPSLQTAVDHGGASGYAGAKTFNSILSALSKFGVLPSPGPYANDFVMYGDLGVNVYTVFYRFWVDFGIVGVVLLSLLSGWIYEFIYHKACDSGSLVYSVVGMYVFPSLLDLYREEYLFSQYLSVGTAIVLVTTISIVLFARMIYGQRLSDCDKKIVQVLSSNR